jgi:hypothetical protein
VANVQDAPEGELRITGVARNGMTLEVNSTLTDPDGITTPVVYQWLTEEGVISGATGHDLTLTRALVGKTIGVSASWQDAWGAAEAVTTWLEQPVSPYSIEGHVHHWRNRAGVEGAQVQIARSSDPEKPVGSTLTDETGHFSFPDLDFDQYVVTGRFSGPAAGAIDAADVLAALKLATGRNPNPDPDGPGARTAEAISHYQMIAADLDKNGSVNLADVSMLMGWVRQANAVPGQWVVTSEGSKDVDLPGLSSLEESSGNLMLALLGNIDGAYGL